MANFHQAQPEIQSFITSPTAMPSLNPQKLGRYEIIDEIGKGAIWRVYLARDPLIGRLVALKTLRIGFSAEDLEREQFRARFMREAQSAGILTHPNIVTIYDVVEESEEGLVFIAMEYVRGTNLKLLLQRADGYDLVFIAGLLEQIADGLDYAHSRGVVHRDIKPANIIITADNRVKITDFGIARIDTSNLTPEGQLLGTPNYMAPEQILGREVDHRADIFSLGVMLYEMFTRHTPFEGETLTVASHRIVYDHFTPPNDYVENLKHGVEPILARALEKDPGRRFQRAREMADELTQLVSQMDDESLNDTLPLSKPVRARGALAPPKSVERGIAEFDVFICHASEDKEDFVESLAQRLKEQNVRVWYDSFNLKLGDPLRTAIDKGLSRSRFGVVVFSQSFCRKDWPRRELEGLLALERGGRKVILPIWHGVTREDVASFSPILADRVALSTKLPLERIVADILAVVHE